MIVDLVYLAVASLGAPHAPVTLPWFCNEAVVIGRAKVLEERDRSSPEDLLGRFERTYRIKVRSWFRGGKGPGAVIATSSGHGQWRADRDLVFFLIPQPDGSWRIRSGAKLRSGRGRALIEQVCTLPPE